MANIVDLNHVLARHDAIDQRLIEWSRCIKVRPQPWKMQSIWRQYRPPRQYAYETQDIPVPINTIAAFEIERIVSMLPDKHRTAVRFFYVFPFVPIMAVCHFLGVNRGGLAELITDSRDMVQNRLRQKIVEKESCKVM